MKKDQISKKDVVVLGAVYVGLLSLVLILPENNSALNAIVLGLYAIASLVAVERTK